MRKNTASQIVGAQMTSATGGSDFTGSVTCYVSGNGGTPILGSVGAGKCTHKGNGFHSYAPSQAETNYDHVAFTFTGSGAVTATFQVYPSFPQTGDSFGRLGVPATTSTSLDIAVIRAIATNIQFDTDDIQTRLPAALVGGRMDSNLSAIDNSTTTLAAFKRGVKGAIGEGSTTTTLTTSSLIPAGTVADKFKGRVIIFSDDTITLALRGQATDITANTSAAQSTFTVTALTTAPVSGDTFVIV
jgi:hypothetical protein